MRFGVQLFGIGNQVRENPSGVFNRLADCGIRFAEPCIVLGEPLKECPQFWEMEEYEAFAGGIENAGLRVESCHILIKEDFESAVGKLKIFAEKYQIRQFVLGCPEEINQTVYQDYADFLCRLAKELKVSGADVLLHNGKNEIKGKIDGVSAYEWLLRSCNGNVYAEPDVGWLLAGGEDPESFLWRNQKYIKALHYKDFKRCNPTPDSLSAEIEKEEDYRETAVGTGLVDMAACFQFARASEVIQYLDQDSSEGDIFEDICNARETLAGLTSVRDNTVSILCTLDVESGEVKELHRYHKVIEAPNWCPEGDTLLYNSEGRIYQYRISEDAESLIDSGFCDNCNNDHVLSPDGQNLAVSHSESGWMSQIYILPAKGGGPRQVTENAPSFLHGWSPDGGSLSYCAFRSHEGKMAVDIYEIDASGGEERQLTKENGFNDGPEYSPDGKEIWFNSTRSGLMQIWKMNRDGSGQRQMTFEEQNNWFAHVSPDQKRVVNIAYSSKGLDPEEHLPNMQVELWIMNYDGSERKKICSFFGGQGSINVNSWSPDSKELAFVKYELLHK